MNNDFRAALNNSEVSHFIKTSFYHVLTIGLWKCGLKPPFRHFSFLTSNPQSVTFLGPFSVRPLSEPRPQMVKFSFTIWVSTNILLFVSRVWFRRKRQNWHILLLMQNILFVLWATQRVIARCKFYNK